MVDLPSESILDSMICAGAESFEFLQGGCFGDSGGLLYDDVNNVVVGVTSFGFGDCDLPLPSIFSRISDQVRKETLYISIYMHIQTLINMHTVHI